MKKIFQIIFMLSFAFLAFSESVSEILVESANKSSVEDSISFVESKVKNVSSNADKRALYIFLGQLYEQLSRFDSAREYYVAAAGIAAGDVAGVAKKSNEQLVLDAVRCALSLGDWSLANSYLNSAIRNSTDKKIQAYIKLYSQWSVLCKASSKEELDESIIILKAYSELSSLEDVHCSILLTLWYITGEDFYATKLKTDFPQSIETSIVDGKSQLLPSPFWFFVPRKKIAVPEIASGEVVDSVEVEDKTSNTKELNFTSLDKNSNSKKQSNIIEENIAYEKPLYLQLGLFRNKENATSLVSRLQEKGFSPRIISEVRPSGTTYYIVAVDENEKGSIASQLRNIGFESYPVFK